MPAELFKVDAAPTIPVHSVEAGKHFALLTRSDVKQFKELRERRQLSPHELFIFSLNGVRGAQTHFDFEEAPPLQRRGAVSHVLAGNAILVISRRCVE